MRNLFSWRVLDGLLRGTLAPEETKGVIRSALAWQIVLAGFYGACLGLFGLAGRDVADARFILSSAAKLPVLILGTTLVTFPSLYVFLTLLGVKLRLRQFLAAALAANTVLATVIASLGPIIGFFCLSTQSYAFIVLLSVLTCAIGGFLGLRVIVLAVRRSSPPHAISTRSVGQSSDQNREPPRGTSPDTASEVSHESPSPTEPPPAENQPPLIPAGSPQDPTTTSKAVAHPVYLFSRRGDQRVILFVWILLFAFVGTQMAWILRPFIGDPSVEWELFRGKAGSFFDAVARALRGYFGG